MEYLALNQDFSNRGRRSEEQVEVMRALWAEAQVKFKGRWHEIDDAGVTRSALSCVYEQPMDYPASSTGHKFSCTT